MNTFSCITFFLNYTNHYTTVRYVINRFCLLLSLPWSFRGKGQVNQDVIKYFNSCREYVNQVNRPKVTRLIQHDISAKQNSCLAVLVAQSFKFLPLHIITLMSEIHFWFSYRTWSKRNIKCLNANLELSISSRASSFSDIRAGTLWMQKWVYSCIQTFWARIPCWLYELR